jgi:hypothetical protein
MDVNVTTRSKVTKKHMCSRIESQGKQRMLLARRKKND